MNLRPHDTIALHYRHVANSVQRQLMDGKSMEHIALQRARAYTCSVHDPVTGGKHCSIGGNPKNEFIVTSTLASQAPPAVGRALGIPLANKILGHNSIFKRDSISYVSIGEGSSNNAHFLSAMHLARYSEHAKVKCPVVFVVSDNKKCISLKGNGWIDKFVDQIGKGMYNTQANGSDLGDVFEKSKKVIDYTRSLGRPSLLLVNNMPRRFGHAATDRQDQYMTQDEIAGQIENDPLSIACANGLAHGLFSEDEFAQKFDSMVNIVEEAFDTAVLEPKITSREQLIASNSQPLAPIPGRGDDAFASVLMYQTFTKDEDATAGTGTVTTSDNDEKKKAKKGRNEPMRKQMTRVLDEILSSDDKVVYVGEDVEHGGYYLVTDGLHKKYPLRVRNFPPDETTLVGAAMGFSQCGLIPILEIPYLKYLDCAADMFYEAIITNWLSNGTQPNGMIVRIQGFDKGIFGGNYHTHNTLPLPPGLDAVCYSNGSDYVRGMRYCLRQARAGRVVMLVDSTDLLNRRHLSEEAKDEKWLSSYPSDESEEMSFHDITVYPNTNIIHPEKKVTKKNKPKNTVVVTYGNGVPTALLAQAALNTDTISQNNVTVIDCPYISNVPQELSSYIQNNGKDIDMLVFADVCKEGAGMPLAGHAMTLQGSGALDSIKWKVIGAAPTYNPLGSTVTFLSKEDIVNAVESLKMRV